MNSASSGAAEQLRLFE